MALSDVWARTLVYFGIAEEEDWDEDGVISPRTSSPTKTCARRPPRSRHTYDDDWTYLDPDGQRTSILRPRSEPRRVRNLQPVQGRTSRVRAASTTRSRRPTGSRTASP